MHVTSTARSPRRSRVVRGLTLTASAGLVVAALPAGTAAAGTAETWVVHEGESIQAVVDQAASGDTIEIEAGTYHEAVCVDGKGLRIVGAGRGEGGTAIVWPEEAPAVTETPCWVAQNDADLENDTTTLQDDVSGLFFLNPDGPVTVTGLATANHPANGIAAWGADGFTVSKTMGYGHRRYGILAADSAHIRISRNIERGGPDGGTAGISVGDSDDAYAHIASNHVEDYNLGIFARESRSGVIENNYVTENCVGILVFDDATTEIPDATRNVEGGDWEILGNEVTANNRYCLVGIGEVEGALRVSGVGVQVTNADYVTVEGNIIEGNVPAVENPATDLDNPAGGLTLLSLPPYNNPDGADPGPVEYVEVTGNTITGNVPVDVFVGSPDVVPFLRDPGDGIELDVNTCATSVPAEVCGP